MFWDRDKTGGKPSQDKGFREQIGRWESRYANRSTMTFGSAQWKVNENLLKQAQLQTVPWQMCAQPYHLDSLLSHGRDKVKFYSPRSRRRHSENLPLQNHQNFLTLGRKLFFFKSSTLGASYEFHCVVIQI